MRSETSTGQWLGTPLSPACERAHLLITRHIDGELDRRDGKELRTHISSCSACRRTWETQAAQSEMVANSLKALWAAEDASFKKKWPAGHEFWLNMRHALPRIGLCALLASCVLVFATRATAPSSVNIKHKPPEIIVDAASLEVARPSKNPAPVLPAASPAINADRRLESPVASPAPDSEAVQNEHDLDLIDELVPEAVVEEPLALPETVPAVAVPVPPPPVRTEQVLADLAPNIVPLKALPGIELKYSLTTEIGAHEEGRVTILGDVLRGRAIVRIETNSNETFEAAQADLDTALTPARQAVARRLLEECLAPAHRKRIEEAVRKLRE